MARWHTEAIVGDEAELNAARWVSLDEAAELMPDMYPPVREYLSRTLRTSRRGRAVVEPGR